MFSFCSDIPGHDRDNWPGHEWQMEAPGTLRFCRPRRDEERPHLRLNYDLDMETLVATRGRDPLARAAERLRCAWCGSSKGLVMFILPEERGRDRGALATR